MITALARKFGFTTTVPATLVDGWTVPQVDINRVVYVAPRGGAAGVHVDERGTIQVSHAAWTLTWSVAAGANWHHAAAATSRVTRKLDGTAVVEVTMVTPDGPVRQLIVAAVVDGRPAVTVTFVNDARVAVAVAAVVRPLTHRGRGSTPEISATSERFTIGEDSIRFVAAPAGITSCAAGDGDLLDALPAADAGAAATATKCRAGGAQAAAVWPVPHTSSVTCVIELAGPTSTASAVPSPEDISRGWASHLSQAMSVSIDDEIDAALAVAQRILLTAPIDRASAPVLITALVHAGFADEARQRLGLLEEHPDDAAVLSAVARWFQIDGHLDTLHEQLVIVARAAHGVASSTVPLAGAPWLAGALQVLSDGMRAVEQPDVADRIASIEVVAPAAEPDIDHERLFELIRSADAAWAWPGEDIQSAATLIEAVRDVVVADRDRTIEAVSSLPASWRGRPIDVLRAPTGLGPFSYGLRWHGARPALLWELDAAPDSPVTVRSPAIDPVFESAENSGETLLADPGWKQA